ncbi:cereblon family protein [Desulfonatronospira sp.]|uniref:cereblon family protein n=1 Tax=Desulfonatronospira sp. TaxID=1962951 RepID=UPI0025BD5AD1|nr:cereblon family protein [Desulfonatronospira sp.]
MYLLLREKTGKDFSPGTTSLEENRRFQGRPNLLCYGCLSRITSQEAGISINGNQKHVFVNPHGLVFQVGCFSWAVNCLGTGPSTAEFSWFPGFTWQIAVCISCLMHLGWRYSSGDSNEFYGLIMDRLVLDTSSED